MIDNEFCNLSLENFKQIEDIIDARKRLGQYNVCKQQSNPVNYRYAYSSPSGAKDSLVRFDDMMLANEGDSLNLKHTDSEITIVRIRCDRLSSQRRQTKWDMHDIAIPGDGSHLGESPSLVNLATLVAQNVHCEGDEYLVPLSSWDPDFKNEDNCDKHSVSESIRLSDISESNSPLKHSRSDVEENSKTSENPEENLSRRPSLAGRISKFIRKHCKKSKTLPEANLVTKNN